MTIDGAVVPGLLFLLAEFAALAAVGYVIVRVALQETDQRGVDPGSRDFDAWIAYTGRDRGAAPGDAARGHA